MSSFLLALLQPLLNAAATAFGDFLMDLLKTWQIQQTAKSEGRAEAERDAALSGLAVAQQLDAVPLPTRDELLEMLRKGEA